MPCNPFNISFYGRENVQKKRSA